MNAKQKIAKLLSLLTVKQVIDAGAEYIEAAGLSPWCLNEGAVGHVEALDTWKIEDLLDQVSDNRNTYIIVQWGDDVGLIKKENKQLLFYLTGGTNYANILVTHAKLIICDSDFDVENPTWDDVVPLLERLRLL